MLAANSVGFSAGASGQHFVTVIERLGITDAMKTKTVAVRGEPVGVAVARGAAEIGVQQIAELLPVAGVDFIGPLPGDLQKSIAYSAGVSAVSRNAEAAKAFAVFFTSEKSVTVLKKKGMDPA